MQNKAIFYFHFDIFIFKNKVAGIKMKLDRQFALFPAAVEKARTFLPFYFRILTSYLKMSGMSWL
jgi:hypothetical protein